MPDRDIADSDARSYTRRDFLAATAATLFFPGASAWSTGIAGTVFNGRPFPVGSRSAGAGRPAQVVVVGAGVAGLTAALELTRAGIDVTLPKRAARCGTLPRHEQAQADLL